MAIYPTGVSDDVVALCTSKETIASALAKANANASIHSICETLYPKPFVLKRLVNRFTIKHDLYHGRGDPTKEDLDRAEQCGKFPYRPSDLFLKMFSDVLLCLERDPLAGVCSPPLIGTSGVMPLTVLSVIPDIMQHYYDCIVLAEHEVILATNYWQPSNSVDKISNGLRELSKRAGTRGQKALPVKIMWDRGQLSQAVDNHAMVDQEGREELKLPTLAEIPNLTLEVINFHRPIMGTFHAKFLIIDRKVALINSNNIQDRPNLEMMCHLEGPVVEAFYDIFLFSWHHKLTPVLPCLMQPKPASNVEGLTADDFKFLETNPYLRGIDIVKAAKAARAMLNLQKIDDDKLAKIKREGDEKEQRESVGGLNTQARFRGVLGALSEGRRGSFGSESEDRPASAQHALNGTSSGSAVVPGIDGTGTAAALKQPSLRFTDVVMQAYDKRRKSFQGAARPAMPTILSTNGPPSQSDSASVSREVSPAASRSVTRADEESASAPRPVSTSLEPSFVNWSQPLQTSQANDLATNGIDGLPASSTETIPHALPALDLPNTSFESQPETPVRAVAQSSAADASALASIDTALLQAGATPSHPPTNGQRPLSPVYSEGRNSASHPSPLPEGDGQQSGTSAAPAVAADASAPIAMFPKSSSIPQDLQTPPSSAFHQQDGASPQPNGRSATPASVASPTLGSSPSSRKLSDLGGGQQGGTAPGSSLSNGQTTPSSVSANRKSFMGGINVGRSRSKSGSIRSGKGGSSILSPAGPPGSHTPRQRALSSVLNAGALSEAWSTVEDTDVLDEFNPHVLHKKHNPFPIALVNRKPHGLPGHQDIRVPQDAAWLAGFRYARKSVFIQTPTFNAKPIVNAAIEACRRGIQVTIYVDLGFNDKGESMPFQGGTNEEVIERMYRDLKKGGHGHEKQLHVYWYTGKDQVRPLNAVKKQRNCHVKFMQIDDEVGIQGNGNQDTQSWYHSCEVNIMVDSKQIVAEWMEALHRQQNTQLYGRVDDDGVWRDRATGKTVAQLEEWENAQKERAERERMESESGSLPKRTGSRISLLRRDSARSANASQSSLRASVPPASSTAKIAA